MGKEKRNMGAACILKCAEGFASIGNKVNEMVANLDEPCLTNTGLTMWNFSSRCPGDHVGQNHPVIIISIASCPILYSSAIKEAVAMAWKHQRGRLGGSITTWVALAAIGLGWGVHQKGRWRCQQHWETFYKSWGRSFETRGGYSAGNTVMVESLSDIWSLSASSPRS